MTHDATQTTASGHLRTLRMVVRMAPPRELSPNASLAVKPGHKNRLRTEWKGAWAWAAYEALGAVGYRDLRRPDPEAPYFAGPVRIVLTYLRGHNAKPWDVDNLIATAKNGCDQLARVGVIADDKQIVDWTVVQGRAEDGIGIVVVTIEEDEQ